MFETYADVLPLATGELCDFLDCGGGMAPPKTTVPGCPLYSGTASYSPSYLPGYGSMTASATASTSTSWESSTSESSSDGTATETATETGAWSETSETSLANSAVGLTTLTTSTTAIITSAPAVVGTGSVYGGSTAGHNGTITSATPTAIIPISTGAAMEMPRVWMGGAGLLGLGAMVAAL